MRAHGPNTGLLQWNNAELRVLHLAPDRLSLTGTPITWTTSNGRVTGLDFSPAGDYLYYTVSGLMYPGTQRLYRKPLSGGAPAAVLNGVTDVRRNAQQGGAHMLGTTATGLVRIAQPDDASPGTSTHPLAGLRQALALQPVIIGPDRSTSTRQLGRRRYELTDHLGNVRVVLGDRKLSDFDPQNIPIPTSFSAEVMAYADYDPFGSLLPGRYAPGDQAGYRFGFNGKEKDDEIHDDPGTSYDFGSRIHDPRVGRWLSLDPLSSSYPGISSYSFALNTPIQGKDADGNVVIFINGIHGGTGGSKAYWVQYAIDVKNRLGDQSARYVDGALGGWGNTGFRATQGGFSGSGFGPLGSLIGAALHVKTSSNVNRDVRIAAGRAQGINDAADIIANLQEGETIKVVTHSMGTAFARGYTEGIMAYARENGLEGKVKFEYELDVNAFQGGDLPADPNVALSQYKLGGMDGGKWDELKRRPLNSVPSVAAIPGAEPISTPSDATKGHAVTEMSTDLIPTLGNGGAARDIEQGNNNEGAP